MPQYPYNDTTNFGPTQPIIQPTYPKQQMVYVVSSAEEASKYPGGGIFIDTQNPVIYSKQIDQSGRTISFDTFDLVRREPDPKSEYVTKAELESMFEKYLGNNKYRNDKYNKHKKQAEGEE